MIEVRGVILSPLLGFDLTSGCGTCTGVSALTAQPSTFSDASGRHVNNDATKPAAVLGDRQPHRRRFGDEPDVRRRRGE